MKGTQSKWILLGIVVLLVAVALLFFTNPGKKYSGNFFIADNGLNTDENSKEEADQDIMEKIREEFPPKEILFFVEEMEERTLCHAQIVPGAKEDNLSGYLIYMDESRFVFERDGLTSRMKLLEQEVILSESEVDQIRTSLQAEGKSEVEIEEALRLEKQEREDFYNSLPPCMMEITQYSDVTPEELASEEKVRLQEKYDVVQTYNEMMQGISIRDPEDLSLYSNAGYDFDSPQEITYFISNARNGAFMIRIQYFQEATEGYAAQAQAMYETFCIFPNWN